MNPRKAPEGVKARQYGDWEVGGWLGGGATGDVYEVTDPAGQRAALKVFRQDRRAKVVHKHELELDFMDSHRDYPGILPFMDSQLEEAEDRSFWYVTPFATPLAKARDVLVSPYEVIKTIATVAATLADLALQGVHHRNLKPSNIFIYEGKAVAGDFAFIPLDETIDLDSGASKPSEYTAPEVNGSGLLIDAERADVYSLARTLFNLLGKDMHDISGLQRLIDAALSANPKARPNMARFGGELFAIYDRAELSVYPEDVPQLDEAVSRLNQLLEGESVTDETRRIELMRQARATYAALVASTIGTSLNSLSRVRSLNLQEVTLSDEEIHIPARRAFLLHQGADAVIASVPGAVLTISVHAGFWDGIESELLKVSVQREWGEAMISMRIYWVEADTETDVWTFGWQQTLRAARSARSFNDLARQTTDQLAVAYEMLSNWVERREMPEV